MAQRGAGGDALHIAHTLEGIAQGLPRRCAAALAARHLRSFQTGHGAAAVAAAEPSPAFPGAQGWAAHTPGGRGGAILRVTTLAANGPGSLRAAIDSKGPRIIVFEVGGIIDLELKSIEFTEPQVIIAGQTAPAPGITLIRGGLRIAASQCLVQHLSVRPGNGGADVHGTYQPDGITTTEAFVERTDSVIGQEQLAEHFAGGLGTPVIIVANESELDAVTSATEATPGISSVSVFTGAPSSAITRDRGVPRLSTERFFLSGCCVAR